MKVEKIIYTNGYAISLTDNKGNESGKIHIHYDNVDGQLSAEDVVNMIVEQLKCQDAYVFESGGERRVVMAQNMVDALDKIEAAGFNDYELISHSSMEVIK